MRYSARSNYLHGNPKVRIRQAKLQRLKARGLLPNMSKAELRALALKAVKSHPVTRIEQDSATPAADSNSTNCSNRAQ